MQKQSPLAKPDARIVWRPSVVAFAKFEVDHGVQRYGAEIDRTQITSKSKEAGRPLRWTLNERWGAGVETQKNVRGEAGGWGRVPFNEPYAPSLSTIYDGA